jgi:hypothetical protein
LTRRVPRIAARSARLYVCGLRGRKPSAVCHFEDRGLAKRQKRKSRPKNKRWGLPRITIAVAAFILSLFVAIVNFADDVKGSQVALVPPDRIVFYEAGEDGNTTLAVAVKISLISRSPGYGDTLRQISLQPLDTGPRFNLSSLVRMVRTGRKSAEESERFCVQGSICYPKTGLAISELPNDLAIPGGQSRENYYAFRLVCGERAANCSGFGPSEQAIARLANKELNVTIELRFDGDGRRTITCRTKPSDLRYLQRHGWERVFCEDPKVSGSSVFF